jgi:hypothetical protein
MATKAEESTAACFLRDMGAKAGVGCESGKDSRGIVSFWVAIVDVGVWEGNDESGRREEKGEPELES